MNGGRYWTRTSDPLRVKQDSDTQKPLQTLTETQPLQKCVTQNVTRFPETSLETSLSEALQELPKDELLRLLSEALSKR